MPRDLTRDRGREPSSDEILAAARYESAREEYQRKLAEETERLRKIAGRSIWRRIYDAILPIDITIRRK